MKQLLFILIILPLFIACSSDNNEIEETQDYTSIIIENKSNSSLMNIVIGYKLNGIYVRVSYLESLKSNTTSSEFIIDENISHIDLFLIEDYINVIKLDNSFSINKNTKNIITIPKKIKGSVINDITDPSIYPI